MNYNGSMRKETLSTNDDGTFTVKGGGWFWVRIKRTDLGLSVIESAPGMMAKKSARLFVAKAKRTVEKYA